jgi:hypothetical protein
LLPIPLPPPKKNWCVSILFQNIHRTNSMRWSTGVFFFLKVVKKFKEHTCTPQTTNKTGVDTIRFPEHVKPLCTRSYHNVALKNPTRSSNTWPTMKHTWSWNPCQYPDRPALCTVGIFAITSDMHAKTSLLASSLEYWIL